MGSQQRRKVALALMAHPDDAEILCAGTLIRLADAGWEIHIATMTPGDCGTMTETPWAISATRTAEAAKSASLVGGTYHCLGSKDGLVVYDEKTIRSATDLMRRITPGLVFTHAPADYMMDHEMASRVARAASFLFGAPNISAFPLHPDTQIPYLYYCDPIEGAEPITGQLIQPTTYVDIAEQLSQKTDMLTCHASQREWLRSHHGMDEYVDAMHRHAAMRGEQCGSKAAEAFVQHRGHPYPQDDLLATLPEVPSPPGRGLG